MNSLLSAVLVLSVVVVLASGSILPPKIGANLIDDMKAKFNNQLTSMKPFVFTQSPFSKSGNDWFAIPEIKSNKTVSTLSSSYNKFNSSSTCTSNSNNEDGKSFCEITGIWKFKNGKECFNSNYIKKVYLSSYKGPVDPLNGIAQCTKTPCGTTEETTVSCNVAFTEDQLRKIEKRST